MVLEARGLRSKLDASVSQNRQLFTDKNALQVRYLQQCEAIVSCRVVSCYMCLGGACTRVWASWQEGTEQNTCLCLCTVVVGASIPPRNCCAAPFFGNRGTTKHIYCFYNNTTERQHFYFVFSFVDGARPKQFTTTSSSSVRSPSPVFFGFSPRASWCYVLRAMLVALLDLYVCMFPTFLVLLCYACGFARRGGAFRKSWRRRSLPGAGRKRRASSGVNSSRRRRCVFVSCLMRCSLCFSSSQLRPVSCSFPRPLFL